MKVAFLHPDLGIGGAERLIVDAALGLQQRGHQVDIYTSHHDPEHCFEETRDGTLKVYPVVPTFPRSINGKGHILFAHLRQLHLTFYLLLSSSQSGQKRLAADYDIFFIDQLSTAIPFLRRLAHKRVVFYGHFPDKLLSEGPFNENASKAPVLTLKALYRLPMDWIEDSTTRQADILLVNSKFTARVFRNYMPGLQKTSRVVYPGINIEAYDEPLPASLMSKNFDCLEEGRSLVGDVFSFRPTLISLNRFEKKKNANLAIKAFAAVVRRFATLNQTNPLDRLRLVLAGGFDPRLKDNIETLKILIDTCQENSLTYRITPPTAIESIKDLESKFQNLSNTVDEDPDIVFLLNFSTLQRNYLLKSPNTLTLLYTPTNEHFGIIPVEGMLSRLPIVACDSGGPTESVLDPIVREDVGENERTGWLRPPDPSAWADAILTVLNMSKDEKALLGDRARNRAIEMFGLAAMAESIDNALQEAFKPSDYVQAWPWTCSFSMPRSSSTSTIIEQQQQHSFYPSNDISTYRDLLLFEERLKTNAANLRRRKSRYQLFLAQLLLLILVLLSDVLLYTSFLVMPFNFVLERLAQEYESIMLHPYFTSGLLLIAVTTLILFFASGMYNEKIGYANRYVPHANRALRSFNLYLNVRTQPRRSMFNPLSYLFPSGRAEESTTRAPTLVPRPSSPRRGSTIPNIPLTDNPRGKLIFSSRVEPGFREGYERYRAAFERKREEQRRIAQKRNAWWFPWQKQQDSSSNLHQPRIQLHPPSGSENGGNNTPPSSNTPSSSRRSTPTPEGGVMTSTMRRRGRGYRSKTSPPPFFSVDSVDESI